jgi:hypothetical protein
MEKPTRDKSQAETEGATIREIKAKYTYSTLPFGIVLSKTRVSTPLSTPLLFLLVLFIFFQNELSAKKLLPCKKKEW